MITKATLSGPNTIKINSNAGKIRFGESSLLPKVVGLGYSHADAEQITGAIFDSKNFQELRALVAKGESLRQCVNDAAGKLKIHVEMKSLCQDQQHGGHGAEHGELTEDLVGN